jgi:superoxide dismutase, Fe-Mn family
MANISRRQLLGTMATGGTALAVTSLHQEQPATATPTVTEQIAVAPPNYPPAFQGNHIIQTLPFDPTKLTGLSAKLIKSHWENNYGGALKALNTVEKKLAGMLTEKDLPPYVYGSLKRDELLRTGSVLLHENYFASLGGDGKPGGAVLASISKSYGSYATWEADFKKTAAGLGGGSGWVIFSYNLANGQLHNYWSWDHMHNATAGYPLLALDMYEHAYQMDYGAAAGKYIDAFMQNVNWAVVDRRFARVQKAMAAMQA